MGRSILVTGGARSGKSRFAEGLARDLRGPVLYVATAQAFDEEMRARIKKHRVSRPSDWHTVEAYRGLGKTITVEGGSYRGILIDCITIMVTNLLLDISDIQGGAFDSAAADRAEAIVMEEVGKMAEAISTIGATVIMVTNELGSGIVPEYPLSRLFRDIAGRVNQYLAGRVDEVYLTVAGLPLKLK